MKKTYIRTIGILLLLLAVILVGIFFFRRYFSGIKPALSTPDRDIANLLAEGNIPLSYPPEFELSIFAQGLTAPRVMAFDPAGTMLISIPAEGRVIALPDADHDGRADRIVTIAEKLNVPHGLAFACDIACTLYIAETDGVISYEYDQVRLQATNPARIIDLPGGGRHSTRTLLPAPPPASDKLLISVGSTCDTCTEEDWRRAKILIADKDGGSPEVYAAGLRNAVFMRLRPETDAIWATEMGRDFLGDNLPPDEINIIRQGHDYGWPYCYSDNIPDTEFDPAATKATCEGKTPSHIDIQAHSAPLGLDFFPANGWPEKYSGNMLVAYHGSWNRTVPTGYKVVLFRLDKAGNPLGREDFISGWLQENGNALGRPVDIRILPEGVLYITDDKAGVVYRLALKS